jgi:hypothetical protein
MNTRVKGYNIFMNLNGKKLAGVTSNDFGIKPKMKESLIKDDEGTSLTEQTGYDTEFGISGLVVLDDAETPAQVQLDEIIDAALAGTAIPFVYCRVGSTVTRYGNLKITDYKETSDAENIATYSISTKVEGALTKGTTALAAQVNTVTLTGTSGSAVITGPGDLVKAVTFDTNLTTTAAAFVTANAAAYLAKGIIVTSSSAVITFTGNTVPKTFNMPVITTVVANLSGTVA